jgi:F0F1-type ATP synthase assembly protein I
MDKWVYAARLIGVGFFVGGVIILGLALGFWLDGRFNLSFLWIIGLLLGVIVAVWGVYRMLVPLLYDNDKDNDGRDK